MKPCIAAYLRLSQEDVDKKTNRAKDDSNSIAAQRQIIRRFLSQTASLSVLPIVEFCDDGFSGTNFERPAFKRMIEQIREGEIRCVVVKDLSRFGRDYLEVGDYLEHIFPFLGVRFLSVNDHYDSDHFLGSTPSMDVTFRNLIYDYYSKDLSKKVRSGMSVKQKNGGYVSCCLYGYQVLPGQKHKMVIDPIAAPIVRRIFTDIIAGKSTSQVARELNAEGIPTPLQYKRIARKGQNAQEAAKPMWTHHRIIEMLGNVKYTGCMVNHTRESRHIRDKNQRRTKPDEWIIHENAHEAIVTTEEFEAARAALRNVRPYTKKAPQADYPFFCAHCGRKLQRTFGNDVHFYCVSPYWNESLEDCRAVRWDKAALEAVILEALKAEVAVMQVTAKEKKKESVSKGKQIMLRLTALNRELESDAPRKVQSYLDYREGRITKEEFIARRAEREKRHAELQEAVERLEREYEEYLKAGEQAVKDGAIAERTAKLNDKELKAVMYDAIERINVSDSHHIEIVWKFDDLFAAA